MHSARRRIGFVAAGLVLVAAGHAMAQGQTTGTRATGKGGTQATSTPAKKKLSGGTVGTTASPAKPLTADSVAAGLVVPKIGGKGDPQAPCTTGCR